MHPFAQKIAVEMGGRFDRHQVRDRWHGQLRGGPARRTGRWSADEDRALLDAVEVGGMCGHVQQVVDVWGLADGP